MGPLKPCPWCEESDEDKLLYKKNWNEDAWHIVCTECGARGPHGYAPSAARICWNTMRRESSDDL
jgi:hypothetical protein